MANTRTTPFNTIAFAHAALFVASISVAAVADDSAPQATNPTDEQIRFFESNIRPLLANHCYECHGEDAQEGELRLDSLHGMVTGGHAKSLFVAGKPQSSLLITAVGYRDSELRMPPEKKLADQQIADLTRWIEMGAPHPDSGKLKVVRRATVDFDAGRQHWAYRPMVKPNVPHRDLPQGVDSAENAIDAFILSKLSSQKLSPLDQADKRTLIRRATFDLIGLPPTPKEIAGFLADQSAEAFDRVVDRLLSSPHYGERWGRHWLDVARYADSNGLDENAAHGNAWRYRDYVVHAFNDDRPYDEFLLEQLAGDLLDSGDVLARRNQRLIATGYLVLGPKVLAEVDERKMEMDIVDEQLDTIGRGIMGLTLGCVRCHTHKFDPLEHADYYALAGIFKSTRTMESFTKVAKWNEVSVASAEDVAKTTAHAQLIAVKKKQIEDRVAAAKQQLEPPASEADPKDIEKHFPASTQTELKSLRAELKELEKSTPLVPTAMAVGEGTVADTSIHIRGSHLTLGESIPRRFPRVLAGDDQPRLPADQSGRLEFARWLTEPDHPLTARVMANRIWRWHFGKGLVPTVDNFGVNGQRPTHPQLLDWLAVRFVEEGWSIKAIHRLIMSSQTYQRSSQQNASNAVVDGDNRYYWRFDGRRLEAEAIRDAMLAVAGTLDRTMGGRLLETPNRQLVFNHTSQDTSSYDSHRRSIYVPVIRNHLYDMFQLFDYSDASVLNGNRDTSTLSPQALFFMNSEFVLDVTTSWADRVRQIETSKRQRLTLLVEQAYGRLPTETELNRFADFLEQFESQGSEVDRQRAWQALCQSIVSSSEFIYVR